MKNYLSVILLASMAALAACTQAPSVNIVPCPQSVEVHSGVFKAAGAPVYADPALDEASQKHIGEFAEKLAMLTGKKSSVVEAPAKGGFSFYLDETLATEEYTLEVTKKGVTVKAADFHAVLYSIQSIGQMFPAAFYGKVPATGENWVLPCVSVQDKPRFAYRGAHKDEGRHIFSVDEAKKYIDVMAFHKLNTLHWHLTEDQGWRVEIKKYPKLTTIGAYRDSTMIGKDWDRYDHTRYGGFFTQDELREVVAYAENQGITIIPEIDLPGHMVAAIAAYPHLSCTGKAYPVRAQWGVSDEILCAGKESTFTFIEDVLTEVMDIFPSEYIHIGGDEAPKKYWKTCPDCQARIKALGYKDDEHHKAEDYLQNYVTARVQEFLNARGRKIIGWDEILEGDLAEGATVMSWRGVRGGVEAAKRGFDVVMTPNTYMYLDYYQGEDKEKEPLAIGGYLPIDTVYAYEPFKGLPEAAQKHILGVQCNVWTEYMDTPEYLEYMLLPRLAAVSEVQWCEAGNKDFGRFVESMKHIAEVYDVMGYTYSKNMFGEPGLPGYVRLDADAK